MATLATLLTLMTLGNATYLTEHGYYIVSVALWGTAAYFAWRKFKRMGILS
jgi:hypothetical protein